MGEDVLPDWGFEAGQAPFFVVTPDDESTVLGAGSYGAVFSATFHGLPAAAKTLHALLQPLMYGLVGPNRDPQAVQHVLDEFSAEAQSLAPCGGAPPEHPPILRGVLRTRGTKWIVTERQPYSLHAFIRLPGMRELLGLDGAVLLSMDIADGLAHLHGVLGMIHRDLKPKNVLVGPGGGAKLADLGTAKMVKIAARTNQHTVGPGTAIYHPPEVLDGQYTAAIDIFSLGLTIIEIVLAGKWWPGGNQILHLSQRTCITCTTVCDGDSLIGPIIVVQSFFVV